MTKKEGKPQPEKISKKKKTIKPNGMQMLLNRQKGKESPKKERST